MGESSLKEIWHRITVYGPELSYGKQLSRFLAEDIGGVTQDRVALLYEVEGGGDPVRGITHLACQAISPLELGERLQHTDQLDWATFCFMRDTDEQLMNDLCGKPIVEVISRSVLAVRVIDDSYLDIFTPDEKLRTHLTELYPESRIESSPLDAMLFPR